MKLPHIRTVSGKRRILFDTHDLRLGIFYTTGTEVSPGTCWLHLPCVVIDLSPSYWFGRRR